MDFLSNKTTVLVVGLLAAAGHVLPNQALVKNILSFSIGPVSAQTIVGLALGIIVVMNYMKR